MVSFRIHVLQFQTLNINVIVVLFCKINSHAFQKFYFHNPKCVGYFLKFLVIAVGFNSSSSQVA